MPDEDHGVQHTGEAMTFAEICHFLPVSFWQEEPVEFHFYRFLQTGTDFRNRHHFTGQADFPQSHESSRQGNVLFHRYQGQGNAQVCRCFPDPKAACHVKVHVIGGKGNTDPFSSTARRMIMRL